MLKLNERVALITLNFRKTTGNIQLNQTEFSPEDLAHLPPGFRLGTKPVIERKRLTVFDSLKDEATLLLKNHGIVAGAEDVYHAFDLVEEMESSAHVYAMLKSCPDENIDFIPH